MHRMVGPGNFQGQGASNDRPLPSPFLPGMNALTVADNPISRQNAQQIDEREEERRLYAEAIAARASATRQEIEATGLLPNVDEVVESLHRPTSPSPGGTLVRHGGVQKVYKRATFADFDEDYKSRYPPQDDTDNDSDEDFDQKWSAAFADFRTEDFYPALFNEYRRRARTESRKLNFATKKLASLSRNQKEPVAARKFDLIGSLSSCTELAVEICKHLPPREIVKLYSISRDFHDTIDAHMQSSIIALSRHMAPEAARIFNNGVYLKHYIRDPAGRIRDKNAHDIGYITHPERRRGLVRDTQVRIVPGLRWLQMICEREVRTRDIVATLARHGHRLPPSTSMTIKKLWLMMDIPTSPARAAVISRTAFFTDEDLVRAQVFLTKLDMLFNDPLIGPGSSMLTELMLGQRSLTTLWSFLRRKAYSTELSVLQLKIRYDVGVTPDMQAKGEPYYGIRLHEVGTVHFEGWGTGSMHLLRPDELIPMEAARRGLELDQFARQFMVYGHVDLTTKAPLVPSLDEMYMSDDDLPDQDMIVSSINRGCGNVPFEARMWQPKHARKAQWETLTKEEKEMIYAEETLEMDQEIGMDFAEMQRHEALVELQKEMEPFMEVYHEISNREDHVAGSDHNKIGIPPTDGDGDQEMTDVGLTLPTLNKMIQSKRHPEILALVERMAETHTLKTLQEELLQSQEPQYPDFDAPVEEETEHSEFWAYPGNPPPPIKPDTYLHFGCPSTLDEELLMQAEEEYDDEELDYDWEEHIRARRAARGTPEKEETDIAKQQGRYALPITLPGDRDPEAEEDEREEFFRDYYRNW